MEVEIAQKEGEIQRLNRQIVSIGGKDTRHSVNESDDSHYPTSDSKVSPAYACVMVRVVIRVCYIRY